MSARVIEGELVVRVPVGVSTDLLDRFVARLQKREAAHRTMVGDGVVATKQERDGELHRRALELNVRYLEGRCIPSRVRYVTNQTTLFGSCSVRSGEIRISHRVAAMPSWVRDYVIIHELAHLHVADHSTRFWRLVARYPLTERARGFLLGAGILVEDIADPTGENSTA